MTLSPEQIQWADGHVGETTVARGEVTSWSETPDGVAFTFTFVAAPPPSPAQVAAEEARREAERAAAIAEQERAEAQAIADAQAAKEAEEARIRSLVREELARSGRP